MKTILQTVLKQPINTDSRACGLNQRRPGPRQVLDCGSPPPLSNGNRFVQRAAKRQRAGALQNASRVLKPRSGLCALGVLSWLNPHSTSHAATRYVWQDSPTPGPPYANWTTAAHVIQDAVDAAQTGDTVLVAGGAYATGGRTVGTNQLFNRVAIDRAITVESLMGPEVTIRLHLLYGGKAHNGTASA